MSWPLFSVVTPSYNQGRFIRATIESVLSQDYPHVEYIIMDGGSTDETASVVKDYASRVTYISEKDRGQAHAINKGFRMSKGRLVAWLNSDDVFLPGMIRTVVNGFDQHPNAGAVYGEGYLMDSSGNISSRFPSTEPFNLWKLVHLSDYILQQSSAFRKDTLEEVGYLDEDLHYGLDWDLYIRIGMKYPLAYIPEYMGCLREYPEAKSFAGGKRRIRELGKMLRGHTGKWLPPGHIVYGLDTHHRIWCEAVDRLFPRPLKAVSNFLQSGIRFTAGYIIGKVTTDSQGIYSDGWATRTVRYMFSPEAGEGLILEGVVPDWPSLRGQELKFLVNGRPLGPFSVSNGPFTLRVELPSDLQGKLLDLTVTASRWHKPSKIPTRGDHRPLAYLLHSIRREVPVADSVLTATHVAGEAH